jgi:proteasome lid subunit RPN8/RPN11
MGAKCVLATIITFLLEGFHLLRLIDIPIRCDFLSYIQRISSYYKEEICGMISENSLFFVKNYSPEPFQTFYIDPLKYLEVSQGATIDFCFHSHPESCCTPSAADIELSDNALIPFLIFSCPEKRFGLYRPKSKETIYFFI